MLVIFDSLAEATWPEPAEAGYFVFLRVLGCVSATDSHLAVRLLQDSAVVRDMAPKVRSSVAHPAPGSLEAVARESRNEEMARALENHEVKSLRGPGVTVCPPVEHLQLELDLHTVDSLLRKCHVALYVNALV